MTLTVSEYALKIIIKGVEGLSDFNGIDNAPYGHGYVVVGVIGFHHGNCGVGILGVGLIART